MGGYYNKFETKSDDREYAPGFDNFDYGSDIPNIEPDLEYIALSESETTEKALFGEVGYAFTEQFNVTFGARFYEYDIESQSGSAIPLYDVWSDILTHRLTMYHWRPLQPVTMAAYLSLMPATPLTMASLATLPSAKGSVSVVVTA